MRQSRSSIAQELFWSSILSNVFFGLSLEKQEKNGESEKAYKVAAASKGSDPLAWQGLITLYEKQGNKKIDDYRIAALHLAEYYMSL